MARGDQLGRQWKIIQLLLAAKKGKSVTDLCNHLECHNRTVYRDLEALEKAGFPIYTHKEDGKTLWSLLDTLKHQVPIPLNLTELLALYLSRDMLKILKGTVFFESLQTLFEKIKSTLPPEYEAHLKKIEKSLQVGSGPYKRHKDLGPAVTSVQEAIAERKYIDLRYFTMSRKAESRRKIAPFKVWYFEGSFYLIGYCEMRKDIRVFALDRIKSMELTDETFEIPESIDADNLMESSFGVFRGDPVQVEIRFSPRIAGYIREKIWHESQKINILDDGSLLFTAQVAGTEEIKLWVLKWGADAVVLAPESLRTEIRNEAEAMFNHYLEKENAR